MFEQPLPAHLESKLEEALLQIDLPDTPGKKDDMKGLRINGNNIFLTIHNVTSLAQFFVYVDYGARPVTRFEKLSPLIAQHVAAECGRKSLPAAAGTIGAPA